MPPGLGCLDLQQLRLSLEAKAAHLAFFGSAVLHTYTWFQATQELSMSASLVFGIEFVSQHAAETFRLAVIPRMTLIDSGEYQECNELPAGCTVSMDPSGALRIRFEALDRSSDEHRQRLYVVVVPANQMAQVIATFDI